MTPVQRAALWAALVVERVCMSILVRLSFFLYEGPRPISSTGHSKWGERRV